MEIAMAIGFLGGGRAVFLIRDYRLYIASRFLWGLGQHIQTIAIAWLVYELTRDPLALGFIGLAAFVPVIALALVSGPVADRYDRRIIIVVCSITMAVASAATLIMMLAGYIHAGRVWPLYLVVTIFGAARAFSGPAGQALVMTLVPRDSYTSAAAWNNTINQSAVLIGPSIGGLLFPFGAMVPFAMSCLCLIGAAVLAIMVAPRAATEGKPPVSFAMLVAGYKFIWRTPVILGAITLDLVAVLFAGATALLPIFAKDIFETGPWGLGLLRSMPSVGSIAAALILANISLPWHVGRTMFASVAIYGLATIGFGLSPNIFCGMVFLVIMGAADMISVIIRQTLIQIETPDEMRGRTIAVHNILSGTSNQLGEFESGALASVIGTVPAVVSGGVIAVVASALWMKLFPDLRKREKFS